MRLAILCVPVVLMLVAACGAPPAPSPVTNAAPAPPAVPSGDPAMPAPSGKPSPQPSDKVVHTDEEWRKLLTPEQYRVMRQKGTERAFTGKYTDTETPGVYKCAACGEPLFESDAKFHSGCGSPSFFKPLAGSKLVETTDGTLGMTRTEITCGKCGAHMGHVFDDGPEPTGLRYCINSVSIELEPKK